MGSATSHVSPELLQQPVSLRVSVESIGYQTCLTSIVRSLRAASWSHLTEEERTLRVSGLCERLVRGRRKPPPDFASRSRGPPRFCRRSSRTGYGHSIVSINFKPIQLLTAEAVSCSSAAASSWSGTGRATRGWSRTGWSTSGWRGTGWSTTGRAARVAAALANLAALDLGQAELRHLEAVRLLAAAVAARVATGVASRSAGHGWSRTAWGTSGWSGTSWGTSSGSGTAWCGSRTRSWGTAAAVTSVVEQASIGAVDTGETNQRSSNPCKFHLSLSYRSGAVEREGLSSTLPDTLSGGLDMSLDARLHHCPKFSDGASYSTQSNDFDLKRCVGCETTCRL